MKFRVELLTCVYEVESDSYNKARADAVASFNRERVDAGLEELLPSFLVALTKCSKVERATMGRKRKYDGILERLLEGVEGGNDSNSSGKEQAVTGAGGASKRKVRSSTS